MWELPNELPKDQKSVPRRLERLVDICEVESDPQQFYKANE